MPEDPSSPSPSDTNPSPSSEPPNRPEPVVETPVSASESANTPPESVPQDQSLTPASPEQPPASSTQSPEAPLAPEPAQSQETPSEEPVSMSTSAQTEPSGTTLPAQAMPPESEPIKEENNGNLLNFPSSNPEIPNQVIIEEDKLSFIKEIVTLKDKVYISDIEKEYGSTQNILYGPHSSSGFDLYVIPERGIAYVGHEESGLLLEIWYFTPMTFEQFKAKYSPAYDYSTSPSKQY